MKHTYWLVGASSGIGWHLALILAQSGHRVFASARRQARLKELAELHTGIIPLPCDITREDEVEKAVKEISTQGSIDCVILNAGDYKPTPASAFDWHDYQQLMDINYMGYVKCIHALLPVMRQQGQGEIVINASVAGYRGLPNAGPYGATKAALINLAETLKVELEPENIQIRLVNPGFVKTPLTDKNEFTMPFLLSPEEAANRIYKGLQGSAFEITFPRRFTIWLKLMRCLPYRLFFAITRRMLKP